MKERMPKSWNLLAVAEKDAPQSWCRICKRRVVYTEAVDMWIHKSTGKQECSKSQLIPDDSFARPLPEGPVFIRWEKEL